LLLRFSEHPNCTIQPTMKGVFFGMV